MTRTINGKLTGKAAHTTLDDMIGDTSPHAERLEVVSAAAIEAFGYPKYFEIVKNAGDGKMLEALEAALKEQATLAHIDSLVGDERLTVTQMIDAVELPFYMGAEVYDFTPCEPLPKIDFDSIQEIEF